MQQTCCDYNESNAGPIRVFRKRRCARTEVPPNPEATAMAVALEGGGEITDAKGDAGDVGFRGWLFFSAHATARRRLHCSWSRKSTTFFEPSTKRRVFSAPSSVASRGEFPRVYPRIWAPGRGAVPLECHSTSAAMRNTGRNERGTSRWTTVGEAAAIPRASLRGWACRLSSVQCG